MKHRVDWFGVFAVLLMATAVLYMIFAVSSAYGATATLTWTNPTTNTDDSPIPSSGPGSLASIRYEWGTCAGAAFGTKSGENTLTPAGTTATVSNLGPGTWCFRVFAKNTYGIESDASNVAVKIVPPPTPKPPLLSTITIAYETWRFFGRTYLGRSVGTVPLGTPCGELVTGRNWYEIPADAVALTRTPRPGPLVTQCASG